MSDRSAVFVLEGDAVEILKRMDAESCDALICDPPYAFEGGFMGKDWDRFDTPKHFQVWCEQWGREALRVLRPGAHAVVFGGTRSSHRLTSGLEDAGWEVRDVLMWLHAQGFPKGQDLGKAIDKAAGASRKIIGTSPNWRPSKRDYSAESWQVRGENAGKVSTPATDDAKRWDGWNTALKPSYEPILLLRRPLSESTIAANVLRHGTGALHVDACRVAADGANEPGRGETWLKSGKDAKPRKFIDHAFGNREGSTVADRVSPNGRYPSNVILSHIGPDEDGEGGCRRVGVRRVKTGKLPTTYTLRESENASMSGKNYARHPRRDYGADGTEEIDEYACAEGCPVAALNAQVGIRTSGKMRAGQLRVKSKGLGGYGDGFPDTVTERDTPGDSGSVSRFFSTVGPEGVPRHLYTPKAASSERWAYCRTCERALHPSKVKGHEHQDALTRHPTVKSTALMSWLIRLVTPPGGTILDLFAGTGTTGAAALLEGFDAVLIERDPAYAAICRVRCAPKRMV